MTLSAGAMQSVGPTINVLSSTAYAIERNEYIFHSNEYEIYNSGASSRVNGFTVRG